MCWFFCLLWKGQHFFQLKPTGGKEVYMSIFTGAGVAIVTPMKANGEINYDKLGELLDFQINNSTDAIIICGTTGESATLTEDEHKEAIRFTADYVKKRVPVIAGTGSNCTKTAIELSKEAEKAGVDAVLVVTPYYNKATQKGLIQHYTDVAKSIDLPIIMYNVPSRTGCNIQPETAVKLAKDVDNIVAIKAATGNLSQESKTMMLAEGALDMYSGEDGLIVPLMSIGAKGVISVLSNVAPKQTHDICAKFFAGDIEGARKAQFDALELVDALFCEVNPIPVKTALNLMGMEVGPLRMPLCEMEEGNLNKLKTALNNYGIAVK
jgi:4-hydroxy-tetrahydrodipicolinate synthase